MWRYKRFRRTSLVVAFCVAILVGLMAASLGVELHGWLWSIIGALLGVLSVKRTYFGLCMIVAAGVLIGLWRGSDVALSIRGYERYMHKVVTVAGSIKDDPSYDNRGNQVFRLEHVSIDSEKMIGEARISTVAYQKLKRGDDVVLGGKLTEGFSSYQAEISFATLKSLQPTSDPVLGFRSSLESGVRAGVAEPQASLGLGFIVGESSGVPKTTSDDMKRIGLTHIVVASGYNLTILVYAARRLFSKISKYLTTLFSCLLTISFLLLTGMSPSMARAGVVTGLLIATWHYGRTIHPVTLLMVAAAITALINPVYFWADVGWYLSFTSFAGVLLLAPMVERRLFGGSAPPFLLQVCFETICAQLATLPVELLIFGKLAVLALPANVLVGPFVPFAMIVTAVTGAVGMIAPAVAGWTGVFVNGLIGYMVWAIHVIASVPWAQIAIHVDMIGVAGMILAVGALGVFMYHRLRFDFLETSPTE